MEYRRKLGEMKYSRRDMRRMAESWNIVKCVEIERIGVED